MAKAFNSMFIVSDRTSRRYINSNDYSYRKSIHSQSMKYNNPMHDPVIAKKATEAMKLSWTPERRARQSAASSHPLVQSARDKLSAHWSGVSRPKVEGQVEKNIKSSSCGKFSTPFGEFDSPGQASRSHMNAEKLSRYIINKKCKDPSTTEYRFIENGKIETRGQWKKNT